MEEMMEDVQPTNGGAIEEIKTSTLEREETMDGIKKIAKTSPDCERSCGDIETKKYLPNSDAQISEVDGKTVADTSDPTPVTEGLHRRGTELGGNSSHNGYSDMPSFQRANSGHEHSIRRSLHLAEQVLASRKRNGRVPWAAVERVVDIMIRLKEWKSAREVLELNRHPGEPRFHIRYATVLNEVEELGLAMDAYRQLERSESVSDDIKANAGGLGRLFMKQAQHDPAVACFQSAIETHTRRGDYVESIFWRAQLARAFMKDGKIELAQEHQERVVEDLRGYRGLSRMHLRAFLISKETLAMIYLQSNERIKATELHEEVLGGFLSNFGEKEDSWRVMSTMAQELLDVDPNRAAGLLERVVRGQSDVLGEGHEDTLASKDRLVLALQKSGENREDLPMMEFWSDSSSGTENDQPEAVGKTISP